MIVWYGMVCVNFTDDEAKRLDAVRSRKTGNRRNSVSASLAARARRHPKDVDK